VTPDERTKLHAHLKWPAEKREELDSKDLAPQYSIVRRNDGTYATTFNFTVAVERGRRSMLGHHRVFRTIIFEPMTSRPPNET
jgi:hypothetical protein